MATKKRFFNPRTGQGTTNPKFAKRAGATEAGEKKRTTKRKFQIGSKSLSKEEFGAAKAKLGFGKASGKVTSKVKEALASRTFGRKETETEAPKEIKKTEQLQETKEKGFLEKAGDLFKNINTLGGTTLSAQAEREGKTLIQGQPPLLTPAGGIAGGLRGGATAIEKAEKTLRLNKLSKFKNSFPTTADDIILYGKEILKNTKGLTTIQKFGVGSAALFGIKSIALDPNTLSVWAAIDNIAGQAAFLTRDLSTDVRFGNIPPEEASDLLNTARKSIESSKKFVETSTMLNPLLWANSKILNTAILAAEERISLSELQLESLGIDTELEGGETNE